MNSVGAIQNREVVQKPRASAYPKSWIVVSAVAAIALAAGGVAIAHALGAGHLPAFVNSHQFKLGAEIGSPLGAIYSIRKSIVNTNRLKKEIKRKAAENVTSTRIWHQTQKGLAVHDCHELNNSNIAFQNVSDAPTFEPNPRHDVPLLNPPPPSFTRAGFDSQYSSEPLVPCAHQTDAQTLSFSKTLTSTAEVNAFQAGQIKVESFAPDGDDVKHTGRIANTIWKGYQSKLEEAHTKKISEWSLAGTYQWATGQESDQTVSEEEKRDLMEAAIAEAMDSVKQRHALWIHFDKTLFLAKTEGLKATYSDQNGFYSEMAAAGLYRFNSPKGAFIVGDSEFDKGGSISNKHSARALLGQSLRVQYPESTALDFDPSEVAPMACMVVRV